MKQKKNREKKEIKVGEKKNKSKSCAANHQP